MTDKSLMKIQESLKDETPKTDKLTRIAIYASTYIDKQRDAGKSDFSIDDAFHYIKSHTGTKDVTIQDVMRYLTNNPSICQTTSWERWKILSNQECGDEKPILISNVVSKPIDQSEFDKKISASLLLTVNQLVASNKINENEGRRLLSTLVDYVDLPDLVCVADSITVSQVLQMTKTLQYSSILDFDYAFFIDDIIQIVKALMNKGDISTALNVIASHFKLDNDSINGFVKSIIEFVNGTVVSTLNKVPISGAMELYSYNAVHTQHAYGSIIQVQVPLTKGKYYATALVIDDGVTGTSNKITLSATSDVISTESAAWYNSNMSVSYAGTDSGGTQLSKSSLSAAGIINLLTTRTITFTFNATVTNGGVGNYSLLGFTIFHFPNL